MIDCLSWPASDLYLQCDLVNGVRKTVSYLPVEFAKAGKFVRLKNKDETWDDGWTVLAVYGKPRELTHFGGISRAHLRATGDSPRKRKRK